MDVIEPLEQSFHEPEDSSSRLTKKKYECAICGFATDRLFNFKRHINVHNDNATAKQKKFVCTHCGKQFETISGLTRHSRKIHTQTTKYKCEFCKKLFNEKSHFQGHVSSHINHKAYTCSSCSLAFQYRPNLQRHMKTCGQPKRDRIKHSCEECGAQFSRKDILTDHINCKHQKKRTYSCSFCDAKYFWRSSVSKHINTKHPEALRASD